MNKPERPLQEHVNPDGTFMYIPITVVIGPDVTIGIRTQFLGRVTIGQGSVIGQDTIIYQNVIIQNLSRLVRDVLSVTMRSSDMKRSLENNHM